MKELIIYYVKIIIPLPLIVLPLQAGLFWLFIGYFGIYWLGFRTYVDGNRLIQKGIISKNKRWKLLLPGLRMKYFKELYLSK